MTHVGIARPTMIVARKVMQEQEHDQDRQKRAQAQRHHDVSQVFVHLLGGVDGRDELNVAGDDLLDFLELLLDAGDGLERVAVAGFLDREQHGVAAVDGAFLSPLGRRVLDRRDVGQSDHAAAGGAVRIAACSRRRGSGLRREAELQVLDLGDRRELS